MYVDLFFRLKNILEFLFFKSYHTQINKKLLIFIRSAKNTFKMNIQQSISINTIRLFTQKIQNGDFSDMLDIPRFYQEVIFQIFEVGGQMITIFAESLLEFVEVIKGKAEIYEEMNKFYPQVDYILQEIEEKIGLQSSLQPTVANTKDKYFNDFLRDEEMRLKNPNSSSFYELAEEDNHNFKKKMRMPNLISSKIFNQKWHIAFHALRKRPRDQNHQQRSAHQIYDRECTPLYRCLGCCDLFYYKINIKHPQFEQADTVILCKLNQLNNYKSELKESICALMNSRGGIILFDCVEQYMDISPRGTYITEKEKELYMQQFSQILRSFKPKLSLGDQVDLSFVPIAEDPFAEGEFVGQIRFQTGKYVVRLRVRNRNRYELVFVQGQTEELLTYRRVKRETVMVSVKKTLKYLKNTFNNFYNMENLKFLKQSQHFLQDHRCVEPRIGQMLKTKKKDEQQRQFEYDYEEDFKYTSLLYLRNNKPHEMESWLKSHRKSKYKIIPIQPKSADNLCFFFHMTSHRDLKTLISTKDANPPLFLFVQNAVQVDKNILSHSNFKELLKFIKEKNSTEVIRYFIGDKCYLCAEFKVTLCFMFAKAREMGFQAKIVKINCEDMKKDTKFRVVENSLGSA